MIKLYDIYPDIYTKAFKRVKEYREELAKEIYEKTNGLVKMDATFVDWGLGSIETAYDEAVNTLPILEKVKWAEENGYDGVIIDCMGDPGLDAAKELVSIVVVGALESSIHLASMLGKRFTIISILPETAILCRDLIRKYGLESNLASIRNINIPVLELEKDINRTAEVASVEAEKAVVEDGAGAIILGCTGMAGLDEKIKEKLKEKGYDIEVIDPLKAAIYTAIMMILMGVKQSKSIFVKPRKKPKKFPPGIKL